MDILFGNNGMVTVLVSSNTVMTAVATSDVAIKMGKEAIAQAAGGAPASEDEQLTIVKDSDGNAVTNAPAADSTTDTVTADASTTQEATTNAATDGAATDASMTKDAIAKEGAVDGSYVDPNAMGETGTGMSVDSGIPKVKDPLLSNWIFVIGISAAVLAVSVVLGILLAKRKIKKGIELYED